MRTSTFILFLLLISVISIAQTKTDINCKIWDTDNYCDIPDSLHLGDRLFAINCQVTSQKCDKIDSLRTMTGVWLSFYNKKGCKLRFKTDFANIRLYKKSTEQAIKLYAIHNSGKYFMTILKAKRYNYHIKGKRNVNVIMLFPEAEKGDKIIIDGFIEAEIQ